MAQGIFSTGNILRGQGSFRWPESLTWNAVAKGVVDLDCWSRFILKYSLIWHHSGYILYSTDNNSVRFFLYIFVWFFTYTATLRDTDNQSPPAGTSHVLSFVIQRQNHLDADNIALESLSKAWGYFWSIGCCWPESR